MISGVEDDQVFAVDEVHEPVPLVFRLPPDVVFSMASGEDETHLSPGTS